MISLIRKKLFESHPEENIWRNHVTNHWYFELFKSHILDQT